MKRQRRWVQHRGCIPDTTEGTRESGEEATPTRQILQLALQLDEKGEFYKFIEVFGDSRIDGKDVPQTVPR